MVRHASSTRRAEGVWGRRVDLPLARGWEAQLLHTVKFLSSIDTFSLYSSPMRRCTQTARHIAPSHALTTIHELLAYHSGEFEDLTEKDIHELHPEYLRLSYSQRFLNPRYGEESIESQARRVAIGLSRILDDEPTTAVVVAHYSSINAMAHMAADNWDYRTYGAGVFHLEDGEFLRVTLDEGLLQQRLSHLVGQTEGR